MDFKGISILLSVLLHSHATKIKLQDQTTILNFQDQSTISNLQDQSTIPNLQVQSITPNLPDQTTIGFLKPIDHIFWTNESLPEDGKKVYKDILIEKLIQTFFDTFIAKVKDPKIAGKQILQDPMPINEKIG